MRKIPALLLSMFAVSFGLAQDGGGQMDMAEMQKRMMESMTTGEDHKALNQFVGDWNVTVKVWYGGPGAPAMTSKGTSTIKWVLDGRFTLEELTYTMNMMGPEGMQSLEMQSMVLQGYDTFRKQYVSTIVNNLNTQMLVFRGSADPGKKIFRGFATMDEPSIGVVGRMIKSKTTVESADRFKVEVFDLHPSDDYKVLEFAYERKK